MTLMASQPCHHPFQSFQIKIAKDTETNVVYSGIEPPKERATKAQLSCLC